MVIIFCWLWIIFFGSSGVFVCLRLRFIVIICIDCCRVCWRSMMSICLRDFFFLFVSYCRGNYVFFFVWGEGGLIGSILDI